MQSGGNFSRVPNELLFIKLDWLISSVCVCFTWAFLRDANQGWRVDDWNLEASNDRH